MTVRLRPHHLLCVLTYVGQGYSPAFTANMTRIVGRLARGEDAEIVQGPDEICAALLDDREAHCRRASVAERDQAAARDIGRLLGVETGPGAVVSLGSDRLRDLRTHFASNRIRSACKACEWVDLCGGVAARGFQGVLLDAHASRRPCGPE